MKTKALNETKDNFDYTIYDLIEKKIITFLVKKIWIVPVVIFSILFISMNLKVYYYEYPKIGYNFTFGVHNILEAVDIVTIMSCISILGIVIHDIIKECFLKHNTLKAWITKIIYTYFLIIFVFAMLYCYVEFTQQYSNTFNEFKFYIPNKYVSTNIEIEYIEKVNRNLLDIKDDCLKESSFNGIKSKMVVKSYYVLEKEIYEETKRVLPNNINIK